MKYLLLVICFIFTSCVTLKDNDDASCVTLKDYKGYDVFNTVFTEEENNLIFKLDASTARLASHNGKLYYPKSFEMKLPKNIKDFDFTKFTFVYLKDQFIMVFNNMFENPVKNDTIYFDRDKDVIGHALNFLPSKYYYHYKVGKNRKNIMLKRGTFTIYLFNIKSSNVNEYISLVKSFKINDSTSNQR